MKIFRFSEMQKGWFVGDFFPTAYRTSACEVAIKKHIQGQNWPRHYQKTATEVNLLLSGLMEVESTSMFGDVVKKTINPGDIFVIDPNESLKPTFLKDCTLVVTKIPSIQGDKVVEE